MWTIFILVLLNIGGNGVTSNEFGHSCGKNECSLPAASVEFPETSEELQKICEPVIEWIECNIHYEECVNEDPEGIQLGYRLLATMKDICCEDTLLHAAIIDNLKCFNKLTDDDRRFCDIHEEVSDRVQQLAEALNEEGLISLNDSEIDSYRLYTCIDLMSFYACHSLNIEKECGTVAKDVYVEILQRVGPGTSAQCEYDLLPAVIRLYELEKVKERRIVEAVRK